MKDIIYIFNGHTTYAILVHKANEWLKKSKHIGRTVKFIECETKEEAAAIDMQRFGYQIHITDLELVR